MKWLAKCAIVALRDGKNHLRFFKAAKNSIIPMEVKPLSGSECLLAFNSAIDMANLLEIHKSWLDGWCEKGEDGSYNLSALLVDPSPVVKRAILHNISALCIFLGRQRTNDVLLSHMITYLNDRDWMLRYAFFDCVVDVAACAGGRSLEDFILPLMIQALSGEYYNIAR